MSKREDSILRREFNRGCLQVIGILLVSFVCFVALGIYQSSKTWLPKNVTTLAQFDKQMPKPKFVFLRQKSGQYYIEVVGALPGFPAFASGNPNYIFDAKGKIVDWVEDFWGDSSYQKRWAGLEGVRAISMQEAIAMVRHKEEKKH